MLARNDKLYLEFDPTNKYDTHAIKVYSYNQKYHLGFIDKISAKHICEIVADIHDLYDYPFDKKCLCMYAKVISIGVNSDRVLFEIEEFKSKNIKGG